MVCEVKKCNAFVRTFFLRESSTFADVFHFRPVNGEISFQGHDVVQADESLSTGVDVARLGTQSDPEPDPCT